MPVSIRVAQLFSMPFQLETNIARLEQFLERQEVGEQPVLTVVSCMYLTGACPAEFLFSSDFFRRLESGLQRLAKKTLNRSALLLGAPAIIENKIFNAVYLLADGVIAERRFQSVVNSELASVFSACPINSPLSTIRPMNYKQLKLTVPIGVEAGHPAWASAYRNAGLAEVETVVCHMELACLPLKESSVQDYVAVFKYKTVIVANLLSSNGVHIWPGAGRVFQKGSTTHKLPFFREGSCALNTPGNTIEEIDGGEVQRMYEAIVFALRSFVTLNGFSSVVLGLSGGIDSALVATLACDALGSHRVTGIMLESAYTSSLSLDIAQACADRLNMTYKRVSLEAGLAGISEICETLLNTQTKNLNPVVNENIQARLRGLILMATSNQTGAMLLTTGNKSEIATGYTTLYGDMCGAFNPLKDLYKTQVYTLARWRNMSRPLNAHARGPSVGNIFPAEVLTRPATAELSPGQTDQDKLPKYTQLDEICRNILEKKKSLQELIEMGFYEKDILLVRELIKKSAHKRQQAAPGPKISTTCFGIDIVDPIIL